MTDAVARAKAAGRSQTIILAGSNATPQQKAWADQICVGTQSNPVDDAVIQSRINAAVAAGATTIHLYAFGIFYHSSFDGVMIPYGVNFYLEGDGLPNVGYTFSQTETTPTVGTQFRGPTSWLTGCVGTVTSSGSTATWASGMAFTAGMVGQPIVINGTTYIVATVNLLAGGTGSTLTTTTAIGTNVTAVAYNRSPGLFVRKAPASGTIAAGTTSIKNCALMPAWASAANGSATITGATGVAGGVVIAGLIDLWAAYVEIDNGMFLPWGWYEAGRTSASGTTQTFQFFNLTPNGQGGGSTCQIGTLYIFAQGYQSSVISFDNCRIRRMMLMYCYHGVQLQCAWTNVVDEIAAYACQAWLVSFNSYAGNHIGQICHESLGVNPWYNYLVTLSVLAHKCTIDRVYVWPQAHSATITQICDLDEGLENSCLAFNIGNSGIWQTFPLPVTLSTPFGGALSTSFSTSTVTNGAGNAVYTIGAGGATATPTLGRSYTCNIPVYVSANTGTAVVTITDPQGNVVYNAAPGTTALNLLLLGGVANLALSVNGYTLAIGSSGTLPTFTVTQATVGLAPASGVQAALPTAGVTYVAYGCGIDISFPSGGGAAASTADGSTNTVGVALDTSLASMTQYHLSPGQNINFATAPGSINVRRRNNP